MNGTFPGASVPAVSLQTGMLTYPWLLYLQPQPGPITPVVPGASPFTYTASGPGFLSVSGGTVSAMTLTRGGVTAAVGSPIPMANNDIATVTFSVAPTISFIPG